jgi:hypothetical protein
MMHQSRFSREVTFSDGLDFSMHHTLDLCVPVLFNFISLFDRIDGDKVGSYTIFLSFNKLENWTKALKYMLCNLKWVLYWFIGNTSFAAPSASLYLAQSPNKKG